VGYVGQRSNWKRRGWDVRGMTTLDPGVSESCLRWRQLDPCSPEGCL